MAALGAAIVGSRFVPQQFFPNSSRPELVVELTLKEGASFAATTEQVKKMEAVLAKDEDVRFYTAYTGAGQPRFYLSLNPELPNPGYAQFVVMTKDMVLPVAEEFRDFERARVGDQVVVSYTKAIAWQVKPSDKGAPGVSRRETLSNPGPGEAPGGAIERALTITATITALDMHSSGLKRPRAASAAAT